jgi:predicted transcriptional regulator
LTRRAGIAEKELTGISGIDAILPLFHKSMQPTSVCSLPSYCCFHFFHSCYNNYRICNLHFFSSQERAMSKSLVEMTAEIIQSQISSKQMTTEEIKAALNDTFQTLKALQDSELVGVEPEPEEANPVIDPKKSIQKNKIVCLECGQEFKMLSPKHLKSHSLTSKEYRKKHGFSARQPLCAKALSERRSQSGKERGLPDNLRKAIEMRTKDKGKKK